MNSPGRNACGLLLLTAALLLLPARMMATTALDLCGATDDPCVVSTPRTIDDQSTIDVGARELRIMSGGALDVGQGAMTLQAGTLTVQRGGFIRARGDTANKGGTITIVAGSVAIAAPAPNSPAAPLDASGSPGGNIKIQAMAGNVEVDGPSALPAIAARSLSVSDDGGSVAIDASTASVAGVVSVLGGPGGSAGTISINTSGDLAISGTLDATGGDNGGSVVCLDLAVSQGNLAVASSAVLKSDATGDGGSGGAVNILVQGDGNTTGLATISGPISVKGALGAAGGGDGGDVTIEVTGNLVIDQTGSLHQDGAFDGGGGSLSIKSDSGALSLQGTVSDTATGPNSVFGDGCIEANTDITIGGAILFTGGGTIDILSDLGSVSVAASGLINASGDNGQISLQSGSASPMPAAVLVDGTLLADGLGSSNAGEIDLEGQDSVRVSGSGVLHASAVAGGGGSGGTLAIQADAGLVSLDGPLAADGAGPGGTGGNLTVKATAGSVNVTAPLDGRSPGPGGMADIESTTGPINIFSNINVSSTGGAGGGTITVLDADDLRISGTLTTNGNGAAGGMITVVGCNVTLCGQDASGCPSGSTGVLSSLGPSGANHVTGRTSTAILGTMRAGDSNVLTWSGASQQNTPLVLGQVTPAATVVADSTVVPCPVCGDGIVEPPETCDPPDPSKDCSPMCQLESPLPGDVNGDHMVTLDDLGFLVQEIVDGDGDSVANVSMGTFPGAPGADANGDSVITAADFTALIKILFPAAS
jgi:hypothetical protein